MSAAEIRRLRAQPCWTQVRFAVVQLDGCMRWGLCDTGAANTLPVEVSLPNADGRLLPGAFVQVALPLAADAMRLLAPANVLLFRAEGALVGVVDAQGRVALRRVKVGRNLGNEVEILDGVGEKDRLVQNPPDWLADGQTVVVAPAAAASAPK